MFTCSEKSTMSVYVLARMDFASVPLLSDIEQTATRKAQLARLRTLVNDPVKFADEIELRLEEGGKFRESYVNEQLFPIIEAFARKKLTDNDPNQNFLYYSLDRSAMIATAMMVEEFLEELMKLSLDNEEKPL